MWKYVRIFLPLLIIGFIAPMLMPGPDGKPIMTIKDWLPDSSTLSNIQKKIIATVNKTSEVVDAAPIIVTPKKQMYKWQDKKGGWHFTDNIHQVPEYALAQLEKQTVPKVVNTMAAPVVEEEELTEAPQVLNESGQIDVKKLPEIVEEAKKAKAMMEERNKTLEQL